MKERGQQTLLTRQLKVADKLFFKVWLLVRRLQILAGVVAILLLCLLGYAVYTSLYGAHIGIVPDHALKHVKK